MGCRGRLNASCGSSLSVVLERTPYLECTRSLTAGTTIMGQSAVSSTARTVYFEKDGEPVSCGSTYSAGEALTAKISSTSGNYIFELTGGCFDNGDCTDSVRVVNGDGATLIAPSSGALSLKAGFASSYGQVKITDTCSLTLTSSPAASPTSSPTSNPAASPTSSLTASPTSSPTSSPTWSISAGCARDWSGTAFCLMLLFSSVHTLSSW